MIDKIDSAPAGFDDTMLARWGLKPTAKDILNRARETGAITPHEIGGMIPAALARDRKKMAEVLQELKQVLQSLNISVTVNASQIIRPTPTPVDQVSGVKQQTDTAERTALPLGNTQERVPEEKEHESPYLNAKILREQGLVPDALNILLAAKTKGSISPQQIGRLIPAETSQDTAKLRVTMRWIAQLLGAIGVKIVIGEVHYKKPGSRSSETSYSRHSKSHPPRKSSLPPSLNTTGDSEVTPEEPPKEDLQETDSDEESEYADPNEEFMPKFIFDSESGVGNPYYRNVKDHKFLKHKDLLVLARRWRMQGDFAARDAIIVHNLRLSMKIAAQFMGRGLDYDDLVQEGNIGLMTAVDRFDPDKGFHFTTYATWWVRQRITRAIQNFRDTIRMPTCLNELLSKILKITGELGVELGREPTLEEVAARAGESVEKVDKILHQLRVPVVSLDELAYGPSSEPGETTFGDIAVDNHFPSATTALEAKEDLERASLAIRTLLAAIEALQVSERAKTSFSMYYGLNGHPEGATLESIAETSGFGVTRERIRQMNAQVWEKLAEFGVSLDDKKLVATIKRVHDLENIVGNEADLSPLTEALVLSHVSSVFSDACVYS